MFSIFGKAWRALKKTPLLDLLAAIEAAVGWIKKGETKP